MGKRTTLLSMCKTVCSIALALAGALLTHAQPPKAPEVAPGITLPANGDVDCMSPGGSSACGDEANYESFYQNCKAQGQSPLGKNYYPNVPAGSYSGSELCCGGLN